MTPFHRLLQALSWRPRRTITVLERQLGYRFKDGRILEQALTHRSVTDVSHRNLERLEFLGDAVLSQIISTHLYRTYDHASEGELTRRRSALVNKDILSKNGQLMGLHRYIHVDRGVKLNDAKVRRNLVGDGMEAIIGAIYLDGGMAAADRFIMRKLVGAKRDLEEIVNSKGRLIEYCHQMDLGKPRFRLIKTSGPEHDKQFIVQVEINSRTFEPAKADNKKAAEQKAAKFAINTLSQELGQQIVD